MSEETKTKLEYWAKNTGYYTAKTVNNSVAQWTIAAAATVALPYMGFSNVTYWSDADTQGTEQNEVILNQVSSIQENIIEKISNYNKMKKKQSAYEQLGDRESAIELADDVLRTRYEVNDLAKEFFVATLASGTQEDGIAISETSLRELTGDMRKADFPFNKNIKDVIDETHNFAEHIDEARATVKLPKNIKDIDTVFKTVATKVSDTAAGMNGNQNLLAGISIPAALFAFMITVLGLAKIEDNTEYMQKPKKPKKFVN